MMEAEMASETLGFCPQLTRLVARENFISFKTIYRSSVLSTCPFLRFRKLDNNADNLLRLWSWEKTV
jgi:hypothetical protein